MWGGGAAGVIWLALAMTKCNSNGSERDTAQQNLMEQTARADSLQNALTQMRDYCDKWYYEAEARGDTIRMLREDTSCGDSIAVLNDSIDALNRQLTDCRNRRKVARRNNSAKRQNAKPVCNKGNVTVISGADKQVTVPGNTSGTVIVNNGNNNTVNINNGIVNNYGTSENKKPKIRCVSASATVERTYVITYQRQKCK